MPPPLFDRHPVQIDVPDVPGGDALRRLIDHERAEFAVELGGPITLDPITLDPITLDPITLDPITLDPITRGPGTRGPITRGPGTGPTLRFVIDAGADPPVLRRTAAGDIEAAGVTLDAATQALHLLRTMRHRPEDNLVQAPAVDAAEAIARIDVEVPTTWPSFERTGLSWADLSARLRPSPDDADVVAGMQRWIARLGDGHTNVVPRVDRAALPYRAKATSVGIVFVEVPDGTTAHAAGVRAGDVMIGVHAEDLGRRVGAPAHMHPWVTGRRALTGPTGQVGSFVVATADGRELTFDETFGESPAPPSIEWGRRPDTGTAYLRIRRWVEDDIVTIDAALDELASADRLLVDLRGNVGGSLVVAVSFRRRFLTERTRIGSVRFSTGDGGLAPAVDYVDEPGDLRRWTKRVRFLTDPLTYSASEDALLGLRQLPRVDIVGQRSGGGSGRARVIPLHDQAVLTVSTALTFDHDGTCIEGAGLPVDRYLADDELAPGPADRLWR